MLFQKTEESHTVLYPRDLPQLALDRSLRFPERSWVTIQLFTTQKALERTLILPAYLVPEIRCDSVSLLSLSSTQRTPIWKPWHFYLPRIVYTPRIIRWTSYFPLKIVGFVQFDESFNIMLYINNNETPLGITKSYDWFNYRAGQQLHATLYFVFNLCSKCSISLLKMSNVLFHITTEQNTFFYQRILLGPIFHRLDF